MEQNMFCYQCQETAGCSGCTRMGVCGKTPETAALQDLLVYVTKGLAAVAVQLRSEGTEVPAHINERITQNLFTTITNVNFNEKTIQNLIQLVHEEKKRLVPDCSVCGSPCGRTEDYDLSLLWNAQEDIRSLKSLILFGIRGVSAYAYHAMMLGYTDEELNRFFCKALFAVG